MYHDLSHLNLIQIYCYRNPNGELLKVDSSTDDNVSRERVNVATLRNVFFHSSTVSTEREKRLSVIEEPFPAGTQSNNARFLAPSNDGCSTINADEDPSS